MNPKHTYMDIPSYPARPINGGEFERARPKSGAWTYEPKFNGWRALVHAPSGQMWNRQGKRLTIESSFTAALAKLKDSGLEWVDCEAMERRLQIGKGSLIVFDALVVGAPFFERRRGLLESLPDAWPWFGFQCPLPNNEIIVLPQTPTSPEFLYEYLKEENARVGQELYEGIVAKKDDSLYPIQLRSPNEETIYWVKHRWRY